MDRRLFISHYTGNHVNIQDIVKFISIVLLEYNKSEEQVKLFTNICLQNMELLLEVYRFLLEKESPKYKLIILKDKNNQIIKVY